MVRSEVEGQVLERDQDEAQSRSKEQKSGIECHTDCRRQARIESSVASARSLYSCLNSHSPHFLA